MKIGNTIFQWMRLPKVPETAYSMIESSVKMRLKAMGAKNIFISDDCYNIIYTEDLIELIKLHRFADLKFVKSYRDCDDYSFSMAGIMKKLVPGICLGIVWADFIVDGLNDFKHAFNFFINEKGVVMYIEPQSNKIFTPTKRIRPYLFIL